MRSIRTKFLILILSLIFLSIGLIGGIGTYFFREVTAHDANLYLNSICQNEADKLDRPLLRMESSVNMLSIYTRNRLKSADELKSGKALARITESLDSLGLAIANNTPECIAFYVRFNPEYTPPTSGLFWLRNDSLGKFVRLTPTDLSRYDSSDVEHVGWYYQTIHSGKPAWLSPYENKNVDVYMISYVEPLYKNGKVIGVAGMDIDFNVLVSSIPKIQVYETGYGILLDNKFETLYYHPEEAPYGKPIAIGKHSSAFSDKDWHQKRPLFHYDYNHVARSLAIHELQNGMQLAISAPDSEINQERDRVLRRQAIIAALVALTFIILTLIMTRHMILPLQELCLATKKVTEGNLNFSIKSRARDEIGILANGLSQMAGTLRDYIDRINSLAYMDVLTGVRNKTAFEKLQVAYNGRIQKGITDFGAILFDVNDLKKVNDLCGHSAGDDLLVNACRLICLTYEHSPVFRIGGDEFVAILENSDLQHRDELFKSFEKAMEDAQRSSDPAKRISIAYGFALFDTASDKSIEDVFKRADAAMYGKKREMKTEEGDKDSTPRDSSIWEK